MSTETEQLVVALEARIRDFERNFQKASRTANDNFGRIEKRAKQSADRLESSMAQAAARVGGVFKSFGAGLLGGIAAGGVAGIVGQIGQIAQGIAEIGDQAKRAGVSSQVFQEWATVAQQARIPVDALTDGLKELQLRGDEFATTGKGSAAEAFARLGYSAEDVKAKLADPSNMLLEIIDRLGKFDKAAQIRISDELFGGTAGERFVELLDSGADSIRATINEAHQLGNILSDDVITRAQEIDRQFKVISQTVGTALKGAIVSAVTSLQQFIDSFRAFENQQTASLEAQYLQIGQQRLAIENKLLAVKQEQRDLDAELTDTAKELGFGSDSAIENKRVADLEAEQKALTDTEAQILSVLEARRKAADMPSLSSGSTFTPAPYSPPPATGGGSGGAPKRDASAAAAEREADAVRRLIAELEEELSLIGATDLEREISTTLRQAGAAATDEQKAKIVALVTAIEAERAALEGASEASAELSSMGKNILGGLISDLRSGKTAAEALQNVIDRLADKLIDMSLDSLFEGLDGKGGGLGGIFSWLMSIFGLRDGGEVGKDGRRIPLRLASGGRVSGPGGPRDDKVPVLASDGEFIINAEATRKNRALIEAINRGAVPAFARGGAVGKPMAASAVGGGTFIASPSINITVEGGSRGPDADRSLADQVAKDARAAVRAEMTAFAHENMRSGGLFNNGKFQ